MRCKVLRCVCSAKVCAVHGAEVCVRCTVLRCVYGAVVCVRCTVLRCVCVCGARC